MKVSIASFLTLFGVLLCALPAKAAPAVGDPGAGLCACETRKSTCYQPGGVLCGFPANYSKVVEQCVFIAPKGRANPQCVARFLKNDPLPGITGEKYCAQVGSADQCSKQTMKVYLPTRCQLNKTRDGCELRFSNETIRCNGAVTPNSAGVDGFEVDSRECAKCADEGACGSAKCTVTPYIAAKGCKPDYTGKRTESCKWLAGPAPVPSAAAEVPVETPPASATAVAE